MITNYIITYFTILFNLHIFKVCGHTKINIFLQILVLIINTILRFTCLRICKACVWLTFPTESIPSALHNCICFTRYIDCNPHYYNRLFVSPYINSLKGQNCFISLHLQNSRDNLLVSWQQKV